MTGGAYQPEIEHEETIARAGRTASVAAREWLVGGLFVKLDEIETMHGQDRLRLELLKDEIFLFFGARSAVDGLQGPCFPVQKSSRLCR